MKKTCFVIMPFSQTTNVHTETYWTMFFEIIKRIMEQLDYDCCRSEVGPYKLFANIVDKIESCDVAVAVLTDFNANVWYELGIRHTLKSPTIMLLQQGQKAPFDVSDHGIIFYDDSIGIEQDLKTKIADYLDKIHPQFSDSPVLTALAPKRTAEAERKNKEYESILLDFHQVAEKIIIAADGQLVRKKVLWFNDFSHCFEQAKNDLENKDVSFDVSYSCEDAIRLYKSNSYVAVIVDVGSGEQIASVLSFAKEVSILGQKAYFIFFGNSEVIHKYGKAFMQIGAPAITDYAPNVLLLLEDVINGNLK